MYGIIRVMQKMTLLLTLLGFYVPISAIPFQEVFLKARVGDFAIYQNNPDVTILSIAEKTIDSITISEITLPRKTYSNIKGRDLHTWVKQNAPGHSSWTVMEIDQKSLQVLSTYSISRKVHLNLHSTDTIIASLLSLNVKEMDKSKVPKIGPRAASKKDMRPIWVPNMIVDSKKQTPQKVDVYTSTWPKDDSFLSSRVINLYILDDFAFPFWIQIEGAVGSKKMMAIDSGKNLPKPTISTPATPPEFITKLEKFSEDENYAFLLKSNKKYDGYVVYVMEISKTNNTLLKIETTEEKLENSVKKFNIAKKILEENLIKGKKYRVYLSYLDGEEIKSVISKDIIHWK